MRNRQIVEALLLTANVRLDDKDLDAIAGMVPALFDLEKTVQNQPDQELEPDSLFQPVTEFPSDE